MDETLNEDENIGSTMLTLNYQIVKAFWRYIINKNNISKAILTTNNKIEA
jgi:hypothetical protein